MTARPHNMKRILSIITIFLTAVFLTCGKESYIYQRLTRFSVKSGMSYNTVVDIQQDTSGTIWFATADGLNRFNGNDFTIYRHRHNDKSSIQSNNVHDLYIDSQKRLWVSTASGASYYQAETDNFKRLLIKDAVTVEWIMEASMNKYLISTRNASFLYDLATDTYKEIKLDNHPLTLYSGCRDGDKLIVCTRDRMIESLKFQDDSLVRNFQGIKLPKFGIVPFPIGDNKYYVGTKGNGLVLVDFRNGTVERLQTGDKHWLEIFSLCHDDDGKLWIGSSDGVIIMDHDRSIRRYEPGVIPDNNIRSLFKDSSGGIWIGTEYVGAMYWNKQRDKFKPYADDRFHMQDKIITTLNQDENGTFWVGTRNDGLYRFADGQKSVRHFPMDNIRTLYATKDGKKAYVGGEVLGLHEIDIESGRIRKLHSPLDIMCIIPADNGKLWLGTLIGLYLYDIGTDTPVKMDLKHSGPEKLTRILSLFMDKDKNLWIGAKESLSKYTITENNTLSDTAGYKFTNIVQTQCISQSKDGKIWIGTVDGLVCIDEQNAPGKFSHPEGFQNSTIRGIEEDRKGNLWISSDDGLYRYSPSSGRIRRFGYDDGIRCSLFNAYAHAADTSGNMYFGGTFGIETFSPADISTNHMVKRPIIDNLIVNNVEIRPGDESKILNKNISITREIVLKHWQNSLTLHFSCPDMISEKSCSYAYKMEGSDKGWVNARGMEATYTNLSKGRYTFYLKAANNDGIWNDEPVRLEIRVKPIWYKSTFVEILALLLLTAAIGSLIVWYIRRIKAQKDVEIEQLTKDYEAKVLKNKIESFVDSTYNIKPDDEAFLLSVINHIETNIGNPSFSVEALAEFACCSRGNLHLRIKNITGKSPVELIKIMRMKKASSLLKDTDLSISDIAEQCGYQTNAYFITVFKNHFGETPGKYAARIRTR